MSGADPAQSLLGFTTDDTPPPLGHSWNQLKLLILSVFRFRSCHKSSARSSVLSPASSSSDTYVSIRDTDDDDDDDTGHSDITDVDDGSSTDFDSAQGNSLGDIVGELHSVVIDIDGISQTLSDDIQHIPLVPENGHEGIELPSQSKISHVARSINAASKDNSHDGKLQRSQTKRIICIMREKDINSFRDFNGIQGVAKAMNTDLAKGLSEEDDINQRKRKNVMQSQIPKCHFIYFLIEACKNYTIPLLSVAAVLSLGFGLKEEGPRDGWIDGAIIVLTIIILVLFTSSHRYYYERNLVKKSRMQGIQLNMDVHVTRGECKQIINISDLVQGDIVLLERGYQVPCDGFFIDGKSLEVDGTSQSIIDDQHPFLFYGSRVINGSGRMIVASVGTNTVWSEVMGKTNTGDKKSKVEAHLDKLTKCIHIVGLLITILIFIVSFLRFILGKLNYVYGFESEAKTEPTALRVIINTIERIITEPKGTARTLTSLLSVSLVGIMEGMPFVISIAINQWNYYILSERATWRDLLACVKMASVTCICTDRIGGLTEHPMEVDTLFVGYEVISESSMLSPKVLEALCEGIGVSVLTSQVACNAMEASLCYWAEDVIGFRSTNLNCKIRQCTKSDESENPCGVLMEKTGDGGKELCLHWKGPVKEILANCSRYYDTDGQVQSMDIQKRLDFEHINTDMLNKQLKTLAFACKQTTIDAVEGNDLILIGLIGLKDSRKETTKVAIANAFKEGRVRTILVSSDDVSVLKPIAVEYEVLNQKSNLVLKGEDFQKLTRAEIMEKIDQICVLGNCLPADKLLFVKYLKESGKVVAKVGWQINDAPALKESDLGVAMGTWNSGVARESSDITFWNGDLKYLFDAIRRGGYVFGKLQKFIQVQLVMTISSSLINFVGIIFTGNAPMTTIQLFGLNLIMTLIDGMALLIWPLTENQVSQITITPADPLITMVMTRNIVAQSSYQIIILMALQLNWHLIKGITQESIQSMIFNSLIVCQVFNLLTARELKKKNFFRGIHHDYWFVGALVVYILLHIVFVAVDCKVVKSTNLSCELWAGCFFIGIITLLVDWVCKLALPSTRIEWFTGSFIKCVGKWKSVFISERLVTVPDIRMKARVIFWIGQMSHIIGHPLPVTIQ